MICDSLQSTQPMIHDGYEFSVDPQFILRDPSLGLRVALPSAARHALPISKGQPDFPASSLGSPSKRDDFAVDSPSTVHGDRGRTIK